MLAYVNIYSSSICSSESAITHAVQRTASRQVGGGWVLIGSGDPENEIWVLEWLKIRLQLSRDIARANAGVTPQQLCGTGFFDGFRATCGDGYWRVEIDCDETYRGPIRTNPRRKPGRKGNR